MTRPGSHYGISVMRASLGRRLRWLADRINPPVSVEYEYKGMPKAKMKDKLETVEWATVSRSAVSRNRKHLKSV